MYTVDRINGVKNNVNINFNTHLSYSHVINLIIIMLNNIY